MAKLMSEMWKVVVTTGQDTPYIRGRVPLTLPGPIRDLLMLALVTSFTTIKYWPVNVPLHLNTVLYYKFFPWMEVHAPPPHPSHPTPFPPNKQSSHPATYKSSILGWPASHAENAGPLHPHPKPKALCTYLPVSPNRSNNLNKPSYTTVLCLGTHKAPHATPLSPSHSPSHSHNSSSPTHPPTPPPLSTTHLPCPQPSHTLPHTLPSPTCTPLPPLPSTSTPALTPSLSPSHPTHPQSPNNLFLTTTMKKAHNQAPQL
eukprot:Phypoly_transcript_02806.p2 GENE.Phypoly_transcript_02806~~Phypoly_transcript_02806.p2  ORF type:complete len:258 (+),score=54.94 Phypoly_transcript_02806:106-879(+)